MDRILRISIENEPEVLMRITALLKRKGYSMKKIVMEMDAMTDLACVDITLVDCDNTLGRAINTIEKVVDVHNVSELMASSFVKVHQFGRQIK